MERRESDGNPLQSRSAYYRRMRSLALEKREEYGVETHTLNLTFIRGIYKQEEITIDLWDLKGRRIRASYFCDDDDYSVLVNKNLPREPRLFALAHELKHHYEDQETIRGGRIKCGDYNKNEFIEKSAEVFAAEFIYPEDEMRALALQLGIDKLACTPEKVIEFKRACPACVSYKFIVKRFEWFGFCPKGAYDRIHFKKLEEECHGVPFYKQKWFKEQRKRKEGN